MIHRSDAKILILNSRQTLRPFGNDAWITNTEKAVLESKERGAIILTSIGMSSWEMTLYLASRHKVRLMIYIPLAPDENADRVTKGIIEGFHLDDGLIGWRFLECDKKRSKKSNFQELRDRTMMREADLIFPVSIRSGGNLDEQLRMARANGAAVEDNFRVEYQRDHRICKISVDKNKIDPEIDMLLDDYLIHWTKSSNGPWPGETSFQFYQAIAGCEDHYARSALDTLIRIVLERKLRASSRHYRTEYPAVPFSSLKPSAAAALMRWRARYQEMTFEPYGIAIRADFAEKLSIKRVFYGHRDMYQYLDTEDRPYFQNMGIRGDWTPEKEYRHIGDLDLSKLRSDDSILIVNHAEERDRFRDISDLPVVSYYSR
ncbi:hypothetical protein TRIP_C90460 [Candidatus Zixiibacteriota bacterium]|nr:hypothetical protein TRIP_C90460 [candidate division Zixibacteria bacterium]